MKTTRLFRLLSAGLLAMLLCQCEIPEPRQKNKISPVTLEVPTTTAIHLHGKKTKPQPYICNSVQIEYWQDATFDGGGALLAKLLEKMETMTPEEFFALIIWIAAMDEMGYDIFAIKARISNPCRQQQTVSPKQFRVHSGSRGQSYPLNLFLVNRNGEIENWESIRMPAGSSIEWYGYYAAPKNFNGSSLSFY